MMLPARRNVPTIPFTEQAPERPDLEPSSMRRLIGELLRAVDELDSSRPQAMEPTRLTYEEEDEPPTLVTPRKTPELVEPPRSRTEVAGAHALSAGLAVAGAAETGESPLSWIAREMPVRTIATVALEDALAFIEASNALAALELTVPPVSPLYAVAAVAAPPGSDASVETTVPDPFGILATPSPDPEATPSCSRGGGAAAVRRIGCLVTSWLGHGSPNGLPAAALPTRPGVRSLAR